MFYSSLVVLVSFVWRLSSDHSKRFFPPLTRVQHYISAHFLPMGYFTTKHTTRIDLLSGRLPGVCPRVPSARKPGCCYSISTILLISLPFPRANGLAKKLNPQKWIVSGLHIVLSEVVAAFARRYTEYRKKKLEEKEEEKKTPKTGHRTIVMVLISFLFINRLG